MERRKILLSLTVLTAFLGVSLLVKSLNLFQSETLPEQNTPLAELPVSPSAPTSPANPSSPSITTKVTRVIDGDTFDIEGGETVRLIGIDTPETKDPRRPVGCFGAEAEAQTKKLIEGKNIRLEKDVSETDKYGRLLRYVYLDQIFINEYLVKNGFAGASTYPPDVKYQAVFKQAETEARNAKRGMWSDCPTSDSSNPTGPSNPSVLSASSTSCQIKGNLSSNGDKIYHLPGQRYYEKTKIDQSLGERWFCSEAEAQTAGWRKSKV